MGNADKRRTRLLLLIALVSISIIGCTSIPGSEDAAKISNKPQSDYWEAKTPMPTARAFMSTCVVDNKIYAIGGGAGYATNPAVEVYDPATDTWTKKADMPKGRTFLSSAVVDGKIYVIGGHDGASGYLATVVISQIKKVNLS